MDSTATHQALLNIEKNLTQLASAREQVNSVSAKSEQLVETVSELIESLGKVKKEIDFENNSLSTDLRSAVDKFTIQIDNRSKEIQEQAEVILKKQEKLYEDSIKKSEDAQSDISLKANEAVSAIKRDLGEIPNEFRNTTKHLSSDLKTAIDQSIDQLKSYNEKVADLQNKLTILDLEKKLDQNSAGTQNKIIASEKRTKLFLTVGFIATILINAMLIIGLN